MSNRPYLLITNDDGIHSPGIKHLWQAVHEYADVVIVAPQFEKSGAGLSITWTKPLHLHPIPWDKNTPAWSVSGTPADCVKMALNVILERRPDMIISGVNRGSNAGKTVLYSGTIGGVIEGALKNIPGIAFSFSDSVVPPLSITKNYIFPIVNYFLKNPLPNGTLLNVNFPYQTEKGLKGFRMAKQGKSYWREAPERRLHPEGVPYYWLGGIWGATEEDTTSDVALLDQGYVAAVPIHVGEMTCQDTLKKYKDVTESSLTCLSLTNEPLPSETPR